MRKACSELGIKRLHARRHVTQALETAIGAGKRTFPFYVDYVVRIERVTILDYLLDKVIEQLPLCYSNRKRVHSVTL